MTAPWRRPLPPIRANPAPGAGLAGRESGRADPRHPWHHRPKHLSSTGMWRDRRLRPILWAKPSAASLPWTAG